MKKRIEVTKATVENETLHLFTDDTELDVKELSPKKQMLVDSARLAFIYILENDSDFIYVSVTHPFWRELNELLTRPVPVVLHVNESTIELDGIVEELNYLVDNIEGNANYGDEMVSKVEELFL